MKVADIPVVPVAQVELEGVDFLMDGSLVALYGEGRIYRYRSPAFTRLEHAIPRAPRSMRRLLNIMDYGEPVSRHLTTSHHDDSIAVFGVDEGWLWRPNVQTWSPEPHRLDHAVNGTFHPTRPLIAVGDAGSADVHLLHTDTPSPRKVKTFTGHSERVRTLDFSPNGEWLASGSRDGTVRIWEVGRA
jgi:WD40 repeat protein